MKRKIIGILVLMLLIATTSLPMIGAVNNNSSPTVVIEYPDDESVFSVRDITVRGKATDYVTGLLGIKWIHKSDVDEREKYYEFRDENGDPTYPNEYMFYFSFTLDEGWNIITIIAYERYGEEGEDSIIVYYSPEGVNPDLKCDGSLCWSNVEPDTLVTGSFTVSNVGDSSSELDWKVESYPNWGDWTFAPSSGDDLKPGDGSITVEVFVVSPDVEESTFTGSVMVVNINDGSDYEIIPVSLTTPKNKVINPFFLRFLENHPHTFSLLRYILKI